MYRSPVSDHLGSRANLPYSFNVEPEQRAEGPDSLRPLIDEPKLAEQSHEASVLEFAHQLTLETIDGAAGRGQHEAGIIPGLDGENTHFCISSISASIRPPDISNRRSIVYTQRYLSHRTC